MSTQNLTVRPENVAVFGEDGQIKRLAFAHSRFARQRCAEPGSACGNLAIADRGGAQAFEHANRHFKAPGPTKADIFRANTHFDLVPDRNIATIDRQR